MARAIGNWQWAIGNCRFSARNSRFAALLLCLLLAVLPSCTPRASDKSSQEAAKRRIDYSPIPPAVEKMLPNIRRHAQALAGFGPRQTGQDGCTEAYEYIKAQLTQAAPEVAIREFSDTVTVPMDRPGQGQEEAIGEFTHIKIDGIEGDPKREIPRLGPPPVRGLWPAYAFGPNNVQACQTHAPEHCPLRSQAGTGNQEPGTGNREPGTGNREPGTGNREPGNGGHPACPTCEQPRELVDLGDGSWRQFEDKEFTGKVVLLDFNSSDAWMRAASLGAWGAIIAEPEFTTVFQADRKYLATLPLHFPRLYVKAEVAKQLRLARTGSPLKVTLASRLRFVNVQAPCLELTIPGKDRRACFVLAAHFDARSIVPDLAYGGDEVWGPSELIELTRHYAVNQPAYDVQIMFVSGHWQSFTPMRNYVAYGQPAFEKIGHYYKLAMGVDMVPSGNSVNLINEGAWDVQFQAAYTWLRNHLFLKGGWREKILKGLPLPRGVELFGGQRPLMSETLDEWMAGRNDRSPFVFAPRYPTAEEPWGGLGLTSFAFQTSRLSRLLHNTPLDRLTGDPERGTSRLGIPSQSAQAVDDQLRPQLQVSLAVLSHLMAYPRELMPTVRAGRRGEGGWGGYAQISGRVLEWDRAIGWFAGRLPGTGKQEAGTRNQEPGSRKQEPGVGNHSQGATNPATRGGNAHPKEKASQMQTLVHAYPVDRYFLSLWGQRVRNFLAWPLAPNRLQHRELQSFMFQDLRLLEESAFQLKLLYAPLPTTQYNIAAYSIDGCGRIRLAPDYGIHGDTDKAFQSTNLDLDSWDRHVPLSLFECGSVELFNLMDPQRYNPALEVFGAFYQTYAPGQADRGAAPFLKITGIKDVQSHTDLERWGFAQYGPTAMAFLPVEQAIGAEIILGSWFTNFAVLNNPDKTGAGQGYKLAPGQTLRLTSTTKPTQLVCLDQLNALNDQRMRQFAKFDVSSPLAKRFHNDSQAVLKEGLDAQAQGDLQRAGADYTRAWTFESQAYRNTVALLVDVVSTTVLYFVLLLPFSFLMERLVLPQRTVARTAIVSVIIFTLFAALLYMFHPGFKLAHNVVVTTTAFVIVVMTIPALILLLVRGVAMLRAIGSKAVITQQSEAESAGVVMAALSLAVSNMRRRRLRTALTLLTITILVVALVLLTTSSAFDFRILEPTGSLTGSFDGLEIYNARDRRQPLLSEMARMYEAALKDQALVVPRRGVNYGYDHKSDNGALLLQLGDRKARLPYFQLMDQRDNQIDYTLALGNIPDDVPQGQELEYLRNRGLFLPNLRLAEPLRQISIVSSGGRRQAYARLRLSEMMTSGQFIQEGDVDVCLLPNNLADALGAKVGDTITVMGLPLKVKGIWTAQIETVQKGQKVLLPGPLDQLLDLDGFRITMMRGSMWRQGEPESPIHAPSSEIVIVPSEWIRKYDIFPAVTFSLVVIPNGSDKDPGLIDQWAEKLAKEILNVDIFTRVTDRASGVARSNRISMHTATHVKGSSMMLVVLGVAVLMILAIMTGTVYERMREIHVFSSVGLSPRHVAGMFLIEALVYAGIAAVLGYFLGIIALKGLLWHLKATGQQQDFYPNYLGVFVVYSIGIAVLATVASSLYPIRLASKIVNPSDARTWQLDKAQEEQWRIRLPFIATTWRETLAMMVYAQEYLAIHQGERSGRFVCQTPPAGGQSGQTVRLKMPVWLAPFERNLTQDVELSAQPSTDGAWWELSLELNRVSGPPYLWQRGAKVFVDMLCKHLLRWRAATKEQESACLARASEAYPTDGAAID